MTRTRPVGTTLAVICAVIAVLAIIASSVDGAVPSPSVETLVALQLQAAADEEPLLPPDEESCAPSSSIAPRIVEVKKSWVESWAVGDKAEPRRPAACDKQPLDRVRDKVEDRRESSTSARIFFVGDDGCVKKIGPCGPDAPPPGCNDGGVPSKSERGPWVEINLLLKSYNELIDFYDEQGRWRDKEKALKERIDICQKLAELRMLAETDGPGAAMQEFYRSVDRPDRALELDLHNIQGELDQIARKSAELDAEMTRLAGQREILERKTNELNNRREQREAELHEMHNCMDPDEPGDDEEDDDADEEFASAGPSRALRESLSRYIQTIENALADRRMNDARHRRLEHRQALLLRSLDRDAAESAPADLAARSSESPADLRSTSNSDRLVIITRNVSDSLKSPPREKIGRLARWMRQKYAELSRRVHLINARLARPAISTAMGPPEVLEP